MREILLFQRIGTFAENKDVAKSIRENEIKASIDKKDDVILNFEKVESATQSFIHALISELIREYGVDVLDRITFKNCNKTIKNMIEIVLTYMQDSIE